MKLKLPVRTQRAINKYVRDGGQDRCGNLQKIIWPIRSTENIIRISNEIQTYFKNVSRYKFGTAKSDDCCCGKQFEHVIRGVYTCVSCGMTKDSLKIVPASWHGTSTIVRKQKYNCVTHLERHIKPLKGHVANEILIWIRGIFPCIYRSFFKLVPARKNFMHYGFVLEKLLTACHVRTSNLKLARMKTASKIKDCEIMWRRVYDNISLDDMRMDIGVTKTLSNDHS